MLENPAARDVALAARLQVVTSRLMRAIRQHAAAGLTPSQLSALAAVESHGPLRISQLAALESVGAPTATRVVATLEEVGLLQRLDDPDDRRACLVELSTLGRKTLSEVRQERITGLSENLSLLTPRERTLLETVLPVLEKVAREEPEP